MSDYRAQVFQLQGEKKELQAENEKLHAFVAAFDAWAMFPDIPLARKILAHKRADLGNKHLKIGAPPWEKIRNLTENMRRDANDALNAARKALGQER